MGQRQYNLFALDAKKWSKGGTGWTKKLEAKVKGHYIDPLRVLYRLWKNEKVPEPHPNPGLGLSLSTYDQILAGNKVWVRLEIYDRKLAGGAMGIIGAKATGFGKGCLFSARLQLKFMGPSGAKKWRVCAYSDVRPNATDDVGVYFPLWMDLIYQWYKHRPEGEPFRIETSKRTFKYMKDGEEKSKTLKDKLKLRGNVGGRPKPLFCFGYGREDFDELVKFKGWKGYDPLELEAHLYSDEKTLGGSAENAVSKGELIATIRGFMSPKPPKHKVKKRKVFVSFTPLIERAAAQAAEKAKKDEAKKDKPKKKWQYPMKAVGTSPYWFSWHPISSKIRRGAKLQFRAWNLNQVLEVTSRYVGKEDQVNFWVLTDEKELVKQLQTKSGLLNELGEEVGQVHPHAIINANHYYRYGEHTFDDAGDFYVVCAVQEKGSFLRQAAAFSIPVDTTRSLLSSAVLQGISDEKLHNPFLALEEVTKTRKALESLQKKGKKEDKQLSDCRIYERRLTDLLKKAGAIFEILPGPFGSALDIKMEDSVILCEAWMAQVDNPNMPLEELKLTLINTSATDLDPNSSEPYAFKVLDWTNPMSPLCGVPKRSSRGKSARQAIRKAFNVWRDQSKYPDSDVLIFVDAPYYMMLNRYKRKSWAAKWSEVLQWIAAGAALLAMCLAFIAAAPAGAALAPYAAVAMWGSVIAGTAGTLLAMYDRHSKAGAELSKQDLFDTLELVANVFTAGSLKLAKGASVAVRLAKDGPKLTYRFFFYGEMVMDGIQGMMVLDSSVNELMGIINDDKMSASEKLRRLLTIAGRIGFTAISFKSTKAELDEIADMEALKRKLKKFRDPKYHSEPDDLPRTLVEADSTKGAKKKGGDADGGKKKNKGDEGKSNKKDKKKKKKGGDADGGEKKGQKKKKEKKGADVTVDPKKNKSRKMPGEDPGPASTKPPKLEKPPYIEPKKFKAATDQERLKSCEPGSCEVGSERLGEAIYAKHKDEDVRPDLMHSKADGGGDHKYVRVEKDGEPDIYLDGTLYQFFDVKFLGDGKVKNLPIFEGTHAELSEYLRYLCHPGGFEKIPGAKWTTNGPSEATKKKFNWPGTDDPVALQAFVDRVHKGYWAGSKMKDGSSLGRRRRDKSQVDVDGKAEHGLKAEYEYDYDVVDAGNWNDRKGTYHDKDNELDVSMVPDRYSKDPRFFELSRDPDHMPNPKKKKKKVPKRYQNSKGEPLKHREISSESREEAMTMLEAEFQAKIPGPVKRSPKGMECYDGKGNPWDVKTPRDTGFDLDNIGASIKGQLTKQVRKNHLDDAKVTRPESDYPPGTYPHRDPPHDPADMGVILEIAYLSPDNWKKLQSWMHSNIDAKDLVDRVKVVKSDLSTPDDKVDWGTIPDAYKPGSDW